MAFQKNEEKTDSKKEITITVDNISATFYIGYV